TIDLTHPSENKGKLGIKLTNRGGGIGKVVVWINGKEVETDVRGKKIKTNVEELEINYTIQDHPYIKPGELNIIEVKAYNKEEYLVSQGKKIYFLADGIKKEPGLYALVAGSSNYSGDALDLNYAAKDAEDFANALGLVGNKFFGEDKVDIRLLTTEQEEFINWPTKENIERNFKEISTTASPFDVFVVYLSGHGTSYGGSEGDFYYLTSDAASGTLTDPVVREQVAISSEEFIEYFKWVPALKQVMILDACHSGQLAEDLLAKRESRSSAEIRALERMKDRTGMYVLAGSAADAVSYETSIYGQGLLTYSLLLGMKGASLRENKFVDVMQLFQFAADKVPELAKDIGGIQKPEVRVPYGGQSFDIGMVNEEIQNKIKLPSPKPLFLRSSFSDENSFDDHLRLSELLDELFADQQANGGRSQVIFIDAARFTGAYSLKGRYVKQGYDYLVQVRLFKGDDAINKFEVEGSDSSEIAKKIIEKALREIE
ncbi:MAG: caspase family protein, partial [Bacteroidetes bacterium]